MSESEHPFLDRIKNAISDQILHEETSEFPFRHHLGASVLGNPCERYLFYSFRWFMQPAFPSRVVRIFKRGHREEERMMNTLRDIGLVISTTLGELLTNLGLPHELSSIDKLNEWGLHIDKPFAHAFNLDSQIKAAMPNHLGGSMDGILHVPANYVDELGYLVPIECKTHNDKNFKAAMRKDLIDSQPRHYSQANAYGYYINARYALYYAENKNDESIDFKLVKLDSNIVKLVERRALNVVYTNDPKQLSRTQEQWRCKLCEFEPICKKNLPPTARNCRSCSNFVPLKEGGWRCMARDIDVPKYKEIEIAAECPQYKGIR